VLTRTDFFYGCDEDVSKLAPHNIWVPLWQDWQGI